MDYNNEQDFIRLIADIISDLEADSKLKNLPKTSTTDDWLPEENHDPKTISVSKFYQRIFSYLALNGYGQFSRLLAQRPIISIRPKKLGGHKLAINGQHTIGLAIHAGDVSEMPMSTLRHPENRSLEECIKIEAELFFAINTNHKNPTAIDKYRSGLCFGDKEAELFNEILELCNMQIEGLGDLDGDQFATTGASRFIKCVNQYGNKHKSQIAAAVNFIRRTWGSKAKKNQTVEFKYRDDLIHGITTLLVFLQLGRAKNGAKLNGRARKFKEWMENDMSKKEISFYTRDTAGGNTHYKIVHRIVAEYNTFAGSETISHEFLHRNGIWDDQFIGNTKDIVGGYDDTFFTSIIDETRKLRVGRELNNGYRTANFPIYNGDSNGTLEAFLSENEEDSNDNNVVTNYNKEYMWQQTSSIINDNFDIGQEFTYQEARDFIYPIRSKDSNFKNEDSFKGTILRELQELQKKGLIHFHANEGRSGRYSRLR